MTSQFSGTPDTLLTIDPSEWTLGSFSSSWRISNIWGSNGRQNAVDDVTFSQAAVPEPTSLGFMALGGLVLGLRRRR